MSTQPTTSKLFAAGAFLLTLALLVFVLAAFDVTRYLSLSEPNTVVLAYTLSTFIFLTLVVFGFVLLRTLVKVGLERKQQKPGAKFKTSLLTALIALTLIPSISLFAFAYGLVNRSIDKWFSVPVDELFKLNGKINEKWIEEQDATAVAIVNDMAAALPADLEAARQEYRLKSLNVFDLDRSQPSEADPLRQRALDALDGKPVRTPEGLLVARRVTAAGGGRAVAAVFPPMRAVEELMEGMTKEKDKYFGKDSQRRYFRDTSVLLLALMTVFVLFAAVWMGLYLSKKITLPIEALSVATREISAGNLDYRVDVEAGDELGMLVTLFNDMAARLQGTTRELEARRHYIEVILESIPTGVISVDADLSIHTLNRAARTMFSIENAPSLDRIFRGPDLGAIQMLVEAAGDGAATREIAFVTPGRPAHSAVTAKRLEAGGFVLVVEDLTEIVRAQKASTWREVARRLAHEIKNPLTPIQLSAERIGRQVARLPAGAPRVATVIQECVGAIVGEVSSLKHLVDEFVRFARLPSVERLPSSIGDLVERTLALYEGRLDGIEVAVDIPKDLPPALMDSMQMKRVLVNLIDNALEALSGEAERSLRIACAVARDGAVARLTIEDTGCGVAPEDRERLFKPYFTTRKDGAGLGLAIVSRIVADHGGYIDLEPNPPHGTRFTIELPLCPEFSLSTTSRVFDSR